MWLRFTNLDPNDIFALCDILNGYRVGCASACCVRGRAESWKRIWPIQWRIKITDMDKCVAYFGAQCSEIWLPAPLSRRCRRAHRKIHYSETYYSVLAKKPDQWPIYHSILVLSIGRNKYEINWLNAMVKWIAKANTAINFKAIIILLYKVQRTSVQQPYYAYMLSAECWAQLELCVCGILRPTWNIQDVFESFQDCGQRNHARDVSSKFTRVRCIQVEKAHLQIS